MHCMLETIFVKNTVIKVIFDRLPTYPGVSLVNVAAGKAPAWVQNSMNIYVPNSAVPLFHQSDAVSTVQLRLLLAFTIDTQSECD